MDEHATAEPSSPYEEEGPVGWPGPAPSPAGGIGWPADADQAGEDPA